MRAEFPGFLAGALAAALLWGLLGRGAGAPVAPEPAASAAVPAPAAIPPEGEALAARLQELEGRLASAASARPGAPAASGPAVADDEVARWILGALAPEGPLAGGPADAEDWINALLGWLADERGMDQVDLEFGPLRERLLVAFLKSRGVPLDAAQKQAFAGFLRDAEGWYAGYLHATAGAAVEERLIAGFRGTAGWEDRVLGMLAPEQAAHLDELAVVLDQWRWLPACDPVKIDPYDGIESELCKLANLGHVAAFDRVRDILRDHMTQCVELHREAQQARLVELRAFSDVEEFCRYLEIRGNTRRRLVREAQLPEEIVPRPYLLDYAMPGKEDR